MTPVGYLINARAGAYGKPGIGYDYILAGDGVHVQAGNALMVIRVKLAGVTVRGLAPVSRKIELRHGRIPAGLLESGMRWMQEEPGQERMFGIGWDEDREQYQLSVPEQEGAGASLRYNAGDAAGLVAEFHSHAGMPAFFSGTDDRDEQGFRIYGVLGRMQQPKSELVMRAGVYGNFAPALWEEVFSGPCPAEEVRTEHHQTQA